MRLYAGSSNQFLTDTTQNQIAEKLRQAFFHYYRHYPGPAEVSSWQNSLRALSLVFIDAKLRDHGVILEYQLPLMSRRLDCMISGNDSSEKGNAVIIELKQWSKCKESSCDNEVLTYIGGAEREVLHPSVQAGQYQTWLRDTHTAFNCDDPVSLSSCSYLHNYGFQAEDVLYSSKFKSALEYSPLFTSDQVNKLEGFLLERLEEGKGLDVLKKILESKYRPSKKLMDHVGGVIKGNSEYVLVDEQLVSYDKVFACAKEGFHDKQKTAIIIKGGPGTGKSVIAMNLVAGLSLKGYNAQYATGSKAFTETMRKIVGPRAGVQFRYFNSYGEAENNDVAVLIMDESHRIRETSESRYTPKEKRTGKPQVEELLDAAKVCVFFIDDKQVVRPNEIGSVEYIKEHAQKKGHRVFEYALEVQFRCNGSEAFINWVNNTLGIERTANVIWDLQEEFDFQIMDSPKEVEDAIRRKVAQGNTGRVTAGFCWPWSYPDKDGNLLDDVVVGDWKRPWDARHDAKKLAPGIPKASLWAYEPNGINQVGCVYTAQGFEFDYVGVIFGKDLVYDMDKNAWTGQPENNADSVVKRGGLRFTNLVKNTYRVLLTRGMKGCYVHFMDKDTERFVRTRIEQTE